MATDAERLDWLERMHTLHQTVEILYLVDAYQVAILWDGNLPPMAEVEGETLRDAIDAAMVKHPEVMRRYGDAWPKREP